MTGFFAISSIVFGNHGDPPEIRTPDTLLKRQVLCRLSYWVMKSIKRKTGLPPQLPDQKTQKKVAGMAGLEPASEGVKVPCLTTWLHPYVRKRRRKRKKDRSRSSGPSALYVGWVKGFEPSTPGTTIRCSNQLSYTHHIWLERCIRESVCAVSAALKKWHA